MILRFPAKFEISFSRAFQIWTIYTVYFISSFSLWSFLSCCALNETSLLCCTCISKQERCNLPVALQYSSWFHSTTYTYTMLRASLGTAMTMLVSAASASSFEDEEYALSDGQCISSASLFYRIPASVTPCSVLSKGHSRRKTINFLQSLFARICDHY